MQPIGLESGIIPDSHLTGPAFANNSKYARLNGNYDWCTSDTCNSWLNIDLGRIITVTGLAFQGKSCSYQKMCIYYAAKNITDLSLQVYIKNERDNDKKVINIFLQAPI